MSKNTLMKSSVGQSPPKALTPEQLATKNRLIAANKAAANSRLYSMYAQLEEFLAAEESRKVAYTSFRKDSYE